MATKPQTILICNPGSDLSTVNQMRIYYPRGATQTLDFEPDHPINGKTFLCELLNFGWQAIARGRTLHLTHPAADYQEA